MSGDEGNYYRRKTIFEQLREDYPAYRIDMRPLSSVITFGDRKVHLFFTFEELRHTNIYSRIGRNTYQALVNYIYRNDDIEPADGTLAQSLILYESRAFLRPEDGTGLVLKKYPGINTTLSGRQKNPPGSAYDPVDMPDSRQYSKADMERVRKKFSKGS